MTTRPAPRSLRGALDALGAGDAEALLQLQADLVDAQASRLAPVGAGSAPVQDLLARRASREGRAVVERHDDVVEIAAPIGRHGEDQMVAIHRLARGTPMSLALAEERLELTAAIYRARAQVGEWGGSAELASVFSEAVNPTAAWTGAAQAAQRIADARRVVIARASDGRIGLVADSASEALLSEVAGALRLAAGEAYDLGGTIEPGDDVPPALRAFAGDQRLHVRTAHARTRSVVVMALGAAAPEALAPIATLLVALRPPRRAILPPKLIDAVARRLPLKSGRLADRRRLARRAILLVPFLLLLLPIPVSVDAPATVEALDRRVVTAPFDGRIEAVLANPGDHVRAGRTTLVRLDSRSAESERADLLAGFQAALSQAGIARTEGRNDDARQAQLQAQQLAARAQALSLQIAQAEIRAPIDGVLGGDDLHRRVGAPVTRGETLFVVARPGRDRVEAKVSDRAIADILPGQRFVLALRAKVLSRPMAVVARIYPVAEVVQGDNIFRVIGAIDAGDSDGLLPGMEGRAAIRIGWAPLGWAILKGPVRWVRQTMWI